jgi:hypothetical protein
MNKTNLTIVSKTQKSILSRLLATEDIIVEHHKNAPTAFFDVKNRRLVLPQWEDMSNYLYDMLVGHEVGHALYTPAITKNDDGEDRDIESLLTDIAGKGGNKSMVMGLLNVVEDARIERLMQLKFPGLRRDFEAAYEDLHENRDFFGIGDCDDLSTKNFGDRINLHFKIGDQVEVPFTDEETELVSRIGVTDSFEDVVDIVRELYPTVKAEYDEKQEELAEAGEGVPCKDGEEGDGSSASKFSEDTDSVGDDAETTSGSGDSDDSDESGEDSGQSSDDDTDDGESADSTDGENASAGGQVGEELPETSGLETVEAFEKSMEQLLDTDRYSKNEFQTLNPDFDYKEWIIQPEQAYAGLKIRDGKDITADDLRNRLDRKVAKGASLLAKQFEMKKAADSHKRTMTAKTGVLDTVRMCNYKITDDIFKRNSVVLEGKNHGLVCFIDWSGSMSSNMGATIEQLYLLATFCKKVNIPFDFYAFSSYTPWRRAWSYENEEGKKCPITPVDCERDEHGDPVDGHNVVKQPGDNMCLYRLIHGNMKKNEFKKALSNLAMIHNYYDTYACNDYDNPYRRIVELPFQLNLGGTPLDDAIVLGRNLVNDFRKTHRLQIVHTVFLTDGDSHGGCLGYATHMRDGRKNYTVNSKEQRSSTEGLLKWFRATTGAKAIGMFLCKKASEAMWKIPHGDWEIADKYKKSFNKDKFINAGELHGYTEFFILKSDTKVQDGKFEELDDDASFTKLRNAFCKSQSGAITSRTVLNRIADLISEA